MSIYAMSDLHLSFSVNKPMDVFGARWEGYVDKIYNNWTETINDDDIVLVPGDSSWGINLDEARQDLLWINDLPGRKILSKGNHDYWWETMNKLAKFKEDNRLDTIDFLFNNAFDLGKAYLCGTRGWMVPENGSASDLENNQKVFRREQGRLEISLKNMKELIDGSGHAEPEKPIICMLHYPIFNFDGSRTVFYEKLIENNVDICIFGHLHGHSLNKFRIPPDSELDAHLVSADNLFFKPKLIVK